MTIIEWVQNQLNGFTDLPEVLQSIVIVILFLLVYEFYHLLFSSVLTWFKK